MSQPVITTPDCAVETLKTMAGTQIRIKLILFARASLSSGELAFALIRYPPLSNNTHQK
jgi:hypothetical protein